MFEMTSSSLCVHMILKVARLSKCLPTSDPRTSIRSDKLVRMHEVVEQESALLLSSVNPLVSLFIALASELAFTILEAAGELKRPSSGPSRGPVA